MIYCKNLGCQYNKECEPFDFQFSNRIVPIYKNIINRCCSLKQPNMTDVDYVENGIRYEFIVCGMCEGKCYKACLWNEEGICTRSNILVEPYVDPTNEMEVISLCKCYSRKNISGHMDWSRYPQGGNIDDTYADKINNEANKFKLFTGSSKSYNRGEHGSKHEAREMPSILQKQAKERELNKLRMDWEDRYLRKYRNRFI